MASARTSEIATGGGGGAVVVVVSAGAVVVSVEGEGGGGLSAGAREAGADVDQGSLANETAVPIPAEAAADEAERVTRGSRCRPGRRGARGEETGVGANEARRIRPTGANLSDGVPPTRTDGAAPGVAGARRCASA
jgi:hypothetical protein